MMTASAVPKASGRKAPKSRRTSTRSWASFERVFASLNFSRTMAR